MNTPCSTALLESALTGILPADDERLLNEHLAECAQCSATLEQLAGGAAWSREAAAMLTEDELDSEIPTRDQWSEIDFTVEHLEPADEPGVLGRLGGYDVLEVIGHGGMGVVLKAYDRALKRLVAVKVLAPHLAQSPVAKKRFAREAQAAAAVVHPNVLAIHQVQPLGRLPFLVMPLVAGESLAQRLASKGTLELKEILRIGMQAAAGLAAAHEQGLVHRDVKPANILLERGVERAVLTDFGLARAADDVTLTRWGIVAGTPQYMSPEQARGEPLDGRSDLFSLGCVLYEMATGISPFRADSMLATMRRLVDEAPQSLESLNPELPPWFVAIVEKLLEKEPSRRFSSAAEVSQLLEGCLAHLHQPTNVPLPEGLPAEKPGTGSSLRSLQSKNVPAPFSARLAGRTVRWIGGAAALLLLIIGGIGAFMLATANPPDISGQWTSDEWGAVELKNNSPGEYSGTYSVDGKESGKIEVKWSRIERQFTGTWSEGKNRFGDISLHLADGEIRGAFTTSRKSKINPATPALADLLWVRQKSNAQAKDDVGNSHAPGNTPTNVNWAFGPVKGLMMFTASSNLTSDALRLRDGHLFNLPKGAADKKGSDGAPTRDELEKWLAESGVNVAIDYHKRSDEWELKLRNVHFAQLPDDDWQGLAAKELQSRFASLKWSSPENRDADLKETGFYALKFSRGITPPMTFAFETDDGLRGVFQFVATNMTSAGVNAIIRLKLLQPNEGTTVVVDGDKTASNPPNDPTQAGWSFGRTKYAQLNRAGLGEGREVLRLRDGEIFSVPKTFSFQKSGNGSMTLEEQRKWLDEKNVNLAFDYDPQSREWELKLRNLRYCEISHDDFRSMTAHQFHERLSKYQWKSTADGDNIDQKGSFQSWKSLDPVALAFQTSDGHYGILGIISSTSTTREIDGKRVKNIIDIMLQYRLLQEVQESNTGHRGGNGNSTSRNQQDESGKHLVFGPVIERTLNEIHSKGSNNALILETGELLTVPEDLRGSRKENSVAPNPLLWIDSHGGDFVASMPFNARPSLTMMGGIQGGIQVGRGRLTFKNGPALKRPEWDASVGDVAEELLQFEQWTEFRDVVDANASIVGERQGLATIYFKSRKGTIGILQFARSSESPSAINIRYKLAVRETDDGAGGIHTDVGTEKPFADVVHQFNTRAEWDPIGKDQPPLSEDELRGAIYYLVHAENNQFSTDEKQALEKAAANGVLPEDWQLEAFTKIDGIDGERFQGWFVYLSKHRADSKQGFLVRQQLLCPLNEAGEPAPLPHRKRGNEVDDGATPLAAAINEFNSAHNSVWNTPQKPLTEEEVVAAIRWWKTRRNDAPVTNGEFAQFQRIADSRELPKGAEFEVIPDFIQGDGTEHFIWSVRIKMPRESKPGWTYAYEIRRQYIHSEGIDDVKRREQSIAWGPMAPNGLQVGLRLEPHKENYLAGQQVTPVFYYRNGGKTALQTSFPRLMTHSYYNKIKAVDADGNAITIDQDPNPTGPVGWIAEPLRPGAQHEIKGLPIVLGDVNRGGAETAIRAQPGVPIRLHFELPNLADQNSKESLSTGELPLSIGDANSATEPAKDKLN